MYQSYKNCPVLINQNKFLCSDISLTVQNQTEPVYLVGNRHSFNYSPTNGIGGAFRLSYYLTGTDHLKDYIVNETGVISGNIGGLYFNSGYLNNYSLRVQPNNPVKIDAEIVFFDAVSGIFVPEYNHITERQLLNHANTTFATAAANTIGDFTNSSEVSYSFSSEIEPVYVVDQFIPERVTFGRKEVNLEVQTDDYTGALSFDGSNIAAATITLKDFAGNSYDVYSVSGSLFRRTISTSAGQLLVAGLGIKQNFVDEVPVITSFDPTAGEGNDWIAINGSNFNTAFRVDFNDREDINFKIMSNSLISGRVPFDAITGPISVTNFAGKSRSSDNFTVNQKGISVTHVSGLTGEIGSSIRISGTNFFRIDTVVFNQTGISDFVTISTGAIEAIIPDDASWGLVTVKSTERNVSGSSAQKFVPVPQITGFGPSTGISGTLVNITGKGFSGVTGVFFGTGGGTGIKASSFTVFNNKYLEATVPSGNTKGFIMLSGQSGVTGRSSTEFFPQARITGVFPRTGATGTTGISISGDNFFPEILYPLSSTTLDGYAVSFGSLAGATGVFARVSNILLTGTIPTGAKSGPVYIHRPDFSTYSSTGSFTVSKTAPRINGVIPNSGKTGQFVGIVGENFFDVGKVLFSGTTGNVTGLINLASINGNIIYSRIPETTGGLYDIFVQTDYGTGSKTGAIQILEPPLISGFSPQSGVVGRSIKVSGKGFYQNITKIFISGTGFEAGVDNTSFYGDFSGLEFFVPLNCPATGRIIAWNTVGYYSGFTGKFEFIPTPVISGFKPTTGEVGDHVTISGSNFNKVNRVSIGSFDLSSFNLTGSTGIGINIPEDANSNFVVVSGEFGTVQSASKLTVLTPKIEVSGFIPLSGFYGDQLQISGKRLNTAQEVAFSGIDKEIILFTSNGDFSKIDTSGIRVNIPAGTISNKQIKISNLRDSQFTADNLIIIDIPVISNITPLSGKHNEFIQISGSGLTSKSFFMPHASGDLIPVISPLITGDTGVGFLVPKEIVGGPIFISGHGRILNSSTEDFIPFPTISGAIPTGVLTGNSLTITGINAFDLVENIYITGNNDFQKIFDTFDVDRKQITGTHITSPHTGYTTFVGSVNSNYAGTGALVFVPSGIGDLEIVKTNIKNLTGTVIRIDPGAPTISDFGPQSGNYNTLVSITGTSLKSVTGVQFWSGGLYSGTGIIVSKTLTTLTAYAAGGPFFTSGLTSGQIVAQSEFGSGVSNNYFTFIETPQISGFNPIFGTTGLSVTITGSGLRNTTELFWGNFPATFNIGQDNNGFWQLTGVVPSVTGTLPRPFLIKAQNNAGTGISSTSFLVKQSGVFVSSLDFLTDDVFITGRGGVTVTVSGQTILVSGSAEGEGQSNTASNIGTGSGWFFQKNGVDLEFKSFSVGANLQITGDDNRLHLEANGFASNTDLIATGKQIIILSGILNDTGVVIQNFSGTFNNSGIRINQMSGDLQGQIDAIEAGQSQNANITEGRLTFNSGDVDIQTNYKSVSDLYFLPYKGNRISLYDGSNWSTVLFTGAHLSLNNFLANTNYDVFGINETNKLTLRQTAWSNDTVRATGLGKLSGVWVQNGDNTRKYLGTVRTTSVGKSDLHFGGRDDGSRIFVYNYYNRLPARLYAAESADSWSYAASTWRPLNNDTGNRVQFVIGVNEDMVDFRHMGMAGGGGSRTGYVGIAVDATDTNHAQITPFLFTNNSFSSPSFLYSGISSGYHFLQMVEFASGTVTFFGDNGEDIYKTLQMGGIGQTWF